MADFIGFVGPAYVAPSLYQDDQDCTNWYCEVDPVKRPNSVMGPGERGVKALYPTPGLLLKLSLPLVAPVRALYTPMGGSVLLAVCGNVLYSVSSSFVATNVGTLAAGTGNAPVSISDNSISAYLVDGTNRYSYNLTTQAFATISGADGSFTGGDRVDIVDDYFIYNKPGTFTWAASNSLSTVTTGLSFSSKDSAPDNIVTLIGDHREVFLLGEKTSEVWTNTGGFPFPFTRIPGTSTQHGCAAKFSVARLGESIAWLGKDDRGQTICYRLNGYQPMRFSTHAVETDLASYSTLSDAIGYTYQQGGHEFYMLTFPTADRTWCYDLTTDLWHKRASRDTMNVLHRHRSNCYAFFQGLNIVGDYQNGKLYALSQSTYTDNGVAIPCIRRAPHITQDLKEVFHSDLQIQFQPGVGLSTGQGSSPQAMLRWSDDGGSTWSIEHWTSIGKIGKYKNRAIWRRLGVARDRVYEVMVTDPVYRVIVSANLNAVAGSN